MCVRMRGAASRLVGGITLGSMSACTSDLGFVSFRSFFSLFPSSPSLLFFLHPFLPVCVHHPTPSRISLPPISPPLSLSVFALPVWTPGRSPESAQDPLAQDCQRSQDPRCVRVVVVPGSSAGVSSVKVPVVCAWNLDQDGRDVMKPRCGLEDVTKAEPKICVRRVVKRSRYGVMNTGSKASVLGFGGSVIKIPVGSYCEEGEECGEER